MVKKGKGKKKGKSKGGGGEMAKRSLIYTENMQEYAKILKPMDDRRMIVIFPDGREFMAHIPGRFRKRVWMNTGDVVIVSRRDFQDDKVDIIYKYEADEVRRLQKQGHIPKFFLDNEATMEEQVGDSFLDNIFVNIGDEGGVGVEKDTLDVNNVNDIDDILDIDNI